MEEIREDLEQFQRLLEVLELVDWFADLLTVGVVRVVEVLDEFDPFKHELVLQGLLDLG